MVRRVVAPVEPELLVWARESANIDRTYVAKRLGVSEEHVAKWEAGEQPIFLGRVRTLAKLYKRPLAVFLLPSPPPDFDALHDYRRLPDYQGQPYSRWLRYEIRRARFRREIAIELGEALGERLESFTSRVDVLKLPMAAARDIRAILGISLETQWSWKDSRKAFAAWSVAIEEAGALVFQTSMYSRVECSEMRAASVSEPVLPVIVVNSKDAWAGRVFSLLHEFVHLLLRAGGVCDPLTAELGLSAGRDDIELYCNQVAAESLVPTDSLQADIAPHHRGIREWYDAEIESLASRYSVSREALLRRLVALGVASWEQYRTNRERYIEDYVLSRAAAKAKRTGGPRQEYMVLRDNGRRYTSLVLESYHSDHITASRACDYLGTKAKYLRDIQRVLFVRA